MMKRFSWVVLALAVIWSAGCAKKREITDLERKQAANLVSEAQFAVTVREYPRAEGLFVQATQLCPDNGGYWVNLGSVRKRLDQRDGARDAYEHGLAAFRTAAKQNPTDADPALQEIYVLALLGRIDDARALEGQLAARYPNDHDVRVFLEDKRLDQILADSQFKKFAL